MTDEQFNEISQQLPDYFDHMRKTIEMLSLHFSDSTNFMIKEGIYPKFAKEFNEKYGERGVVQ